MEAVGSSGGRYLVVLDRSGARLYLAHHAALSGVSWSWDILQARRFNDSTAAAMAMAVIKSPGKMSISFEGPHA